MHVRQADSGTPAPFIKANSQYTWRAVKATRGGERATGRGSTTLIKIPGVLPNWPLAWLAIVSSRPIASRAWFLA